MPVLTTAGSIGPGQSDFCANGRMTCPSSGTTVVPLGTVPSNKTFFLSDVDMSTVATTEIDLTIQYTLGSVTLPIYRRAITSTAPCDSLGIESQPSAPAGSSLSLLLPGVSGSPAVDFFIAGFTQG